jgi:hypothetical protein
MTLGNMRANGVRSLDVCCWLCHHRAEELRNCKEQWKNVDK